MSFTALVPARLGATRLPGKALADLGGKPMVVRVLEQARRAGAERVLAVTDAEEVAAAARTAGFEAVLTGACATGTERVARAARQLGLDGVLVNLQGDEPEIDPQLVRQVAGQAAGTAADCVTAAAPLDAAAAASPDIVKVVTGAHGQALLFSRAPIPHGATHGHLVHVGIYAFAPGRLAATLDLAPCALEQAERLEQLRWLWHGWRIDVEVVDSATPGIDTPAELAAARARLAGPG